MVKFLVLQVRLGKMDLAYIQEHYPKYYEQVKSALGMQGFAIILLCYSWVNEGSTVIYNCNIPNSVL